VPAARLTREEKKAQTRGRLIDAAAVVFARQGYLATSVDDVAQAAGLTKGAVYSNFASKDELFEAVLEERLARRMFAIAETVGTGTVEEEAASASRQMSELLLEEHDLFLLSLEFSIHAIRNPRLRQLLLPRLEGGREIAAEQITKRWADLPLPLGDLLTIIFSLVDGVTIAKLLRPEDVPDDLLGTAIALLFEGVMARIDR
jgi:AcrR family transcriptional regulator